MRHDLLLVDEDTTIINLNIRDYSDISNFGNFRIRRTSQLKPLFEVCCASKGLGRTQLHCLFNGICLQDTQTLEELGMEDDNNIDTMTLQ